MDENNVFMPQAAQDVGFVAALPGHFERDPSFAQGAFRSQEDPPHRPSADLREQVKTEEAAARFRPSDLLLEVGILGVVVQKTVDPDETMERPLQRRKLPRKSVRIQRFARVQSQAVFFVSQFENDSPVILQPRIACQDAGQVREVAAIPTILDRGRGLEGPLQVAVVAGVIG